jgi:hypothetical protein
VGWTYSGFMPSDADALRHESLQRVAALSAEQRIALALWLGDKDVRLYQLAHGVCSSDARAALRRVRAVGRIPSLSNDL